VFSLYIVLTIFFSRDVVFIVKLHFMGVYIVKHIKRPNILKPNNSFFFLTKQLQKVPNSTNLSHIAFHFLFFWNFFSHATHFSTGFKLIIFSVWIL